MRRLQLAFCFCSTEEEAMEKCKSLDKAATQYCRKHYPVHYTSWRSSSPSDPARFIVWYHY